MQRLNTKFIVVLAAFLAVAIGGVGLVFAYNMIKDPERNVRQGRELERQGDYRAASKAYGRAVAKRRSSIEYMDLMRGAILKVVPETSDEARAQYDMVLSLLRQRARPNPTDPEPWKLLLGELTERARFMGGGQAWQSVYDIGVEMGSAAPPGSPLERLAMQTQALGVAMGNLDVSASVRERVEADVQKVIEAEPGNTTAWEAYLFLLSNDIQRLVAASQQITAKQRQTVLDEALARADTAIPNSIVPSLVRANQIRSQLTRMELNGADAMAKLEPLVDRMVEVASGKDAARSDVVATAEQLLGMGSEEQSKRAVILMEGWLKQHPDEMTMRRLLAIALGQVDRDRSLEMARSIVAAPPGTVSLEAAYREEIRADAMERIIDIEIGKSEQATSPEEKASHLAAAKAQRDQLAALSGNRVDEARLLKADAKLAMLAGDLVTASTKLEKYFSVARAPEAETYLLAADTAARRGELGLALNCLNRAVEQATITYGIMMYKAQLELALRRVPEATRTATAILRLRPDDAMAKEVLAKAQQMSKAISLEGLDDPRVKALQEAERLIVERNLDGARRLVDAILKDNPKDIPALTQLARIELANGNEAESVRILDQALALSPNDSYVIQLRAIVGNSDPLERLNKLAELTSEDEGRRAVTRFVMGTALRASIKRDIAAGGRGTDGRLRDLKELEGILARIESALPALREAAVAAAPASPGVIGAQFDDAVLANDLDKAFAVGVAAEKAGNPLLGIFLQARVLTQQRKFDEALAMLARAQQQGLSSAELSRQMGETREAMGQVPEALAAYKDAFERRPNDRMLLDRYTDLLLRSGDTARALTLYRQAASAAGGERTMINRWLRLEDQFGDRAVALCWRRKFYRDMPSDRDNALALAALLCEGRADPRMMVDPDCKPKFTDGEWIALSPQKRQTELDAMVRAQRLEGNAIYKRLLTTNPADFEVAAAQARGLGKAGQVAEGEKVLRTAIEHAPANMVGPMWFALGQYLDRYERTADAMKAFDEARKHQDPEQREAEMALSDFWFEKGQWQRSYDALKPLVDAKLKSIDRNSYRRLAEICLNLRRYEEAMTALQMAPPSTTTGRGDAQYELLLGGIELGLGSDEWAKGNRSQAEQHFSKGMASMRKSAELQPGNALPWIGLAGAERERFVRTGDKAALDQALEYADRGLQLASSFWPGVRLKSDLLVDKEDMVASIQVLERFLELVPESVDARRLLAERHLRNNNVTRALAVLGEGATLSRNEAVWYQAIGELQARRNNSAEATAAFDKALAVAPSAQNLQTAFEQRLRQATPDWKGIVELSRKYPEEVRTGGAAQAILAAALAATGDREAGIESLRRSGRFIRAEMEAKRINSDDLDVWYRALREFFPRERTKDLEAFVLELTQNKLSPDDHRWLAGLWVEAGEDGAAKATEHLTKAKEFLDTMDAKYRARVWLAEGNLAFVRNECEAAIAGFEKAIREDPDDSMSLNNLAYLLGKCKQDYARGLEMARRAVRINTTHPYFLDTYGVLLLKSGDAEGALGPLGRSVSLKPMASNYLHLAQALQALKRTDEARAALEKAAAHDADEETKTEIAALRATLG